MFEFIKRTIYLLPALLLFTVIIRIHYTSDMELSSKSRKNTEIFSDMESSSKNEIDIYRMFMALLNWTALPFLAHSLASLKQSLKNRSFSAYWWVKIWSTEKMKIMENSTDPLQWNSRLLRGHPLRIVLGSKCVASSQDQYALTSPTLWAPKLFSLPQQSIIYYKW